MTNKNKITLLHFITRTGMYMHCVDENGIISFIHGYETGSEECDFTKLVRNHLEMNLAVFYSSDGWPGQIGRYAHKKSLSWITAFKQIGLDVIALEENGGLDNEMKECIKSFAISLINKLNEDGDPWFNRRWIEEWNSICLIKNKWFKKLWTDKEFKIVRSIGYEVSNNKVFEDWKPLRPTEKLLILKRNFDSLSK